MHDDFKSIRESHETLQSIDRSLTAMVDTETDVFINHIVVEQRFGSGQIDCFQSCQKLFYYLNITHELRLCLSCRFLEQCRDLYRVECGTFQELVTRNEDIQTLIWHAHVFANAANEAVELA